MLRVRGRVLIFSSAAMLAVSVAPTPGHAAARPICQDEEAQIVGTTRSDKLVGTSGDDVIIGLSGGDIIDGRGGDDTICGGAGTDVIAAGRGSDRVIGGSGTDVLSGAAGHDILRGGGSGDVVAGGGGNDLVEGNADDDLVSGGGGTDRVRGGAGRADVATFVTAEGPVDVDLTGDRARGEGLDVVATVESAVGGRFSDRLIGDGGSNSLSGGNGSDEIVSRAGADVVFGGAGNDDLVGGRGEDLVSSLGSRSGVMIDLARGVARGEGDDRLNGFENAQGSRRDDRILGDGRDNILLGFEGSDLIDGRAGFDLASFADLYSITANLGAGRASDGDDVDRLRNLEGLIGSTGNARLTGDDASNLLIGGPGSDQLSGAGGDDRLTGLDGGDLFDGGLGDDAIEAGPDNGTAQDRLDFTEATGPVVVDLGANRIVYEGTDTVTGIEEVTGSPFADTITGGDTAEDLYGGAGDDSLDGSSGFDRVWGGLGNDSVGGGAWDDEVFGDRGVDVLHGGDGYDRLFGDDGSTFEEQPEPDQLFGDAGSDQLYGEEGDDAIDGGDGVDAVLYTGLTTAQSVEADLAAGYVRAEGTDAVAGIEVVNGSGGNDILRGDDHANWLASFEGNDIMEGHGGDDVLQTTQGDDSISGGDGDDHIVSGEGNDDVDAGTGIDECWYSETEAGCEHDETSTRREGFEPPYSHYSWNGYIVPRAVSAYVTATGVIGSVVSIGGFDGCQTYIDVFLERLEAGEWRQVLQRFAAYSRYRIRIKEPGTYRVHAIARAPDDDGLMCEPVTTDAFRFAP